MKLQLLAFFSLFFFYTNAQKSFIEKYKEYFELPRESIYVHTNKSIFINGETIWFKGYAVDRTTNTLNDLVRNVQVSVYDQRGNKIEESMVLASEGIFVNQIKIDSTYEAGRYYLKAMTNYMNNFKESDAYFQTFNVVNEIENERKNPKKLELIVRPEGHSITYGLEANVGIKVINDLGYPEDSEIEIFEDNTVIRSVTANNSGLARVSFIPKKDKLYKVSVKSRNGLRKSVELQDINNKGTSLHLSDTPGHIILKIENTAISNDDDFELVMYQDEEIVSLDIDINKPSQLIAIEKNKLFKGLNTFQLLKNGEGVSERLYYNTINDKTQFDGDIRVSHLQKEDSIRLDFNFNTKEKLNLSASFLDRQNLSNTTNNDIIKALRIKPYVNLEDYRLLFNGFSMKNDKEIDFILSMSKGRFFDNINQSLSPKPSFKRKNGFDQIVYLQQKKSSDDQLLIGLESKFNREIVKEIGGSRTLFLKNQYPVIGEDIQFSIIKKDRKFVGPRIKLVTEVSFKDNHPLKMSEMDTLERYKQIDLPRNRLISNFKGATELDEVVIKAPPKEINKGISVNGKTEEVTERLYQRFFKLSVYLRTKGYLVNDSPNQFSVSNYYPRSISGDNKLLILLDGTPLVDPGFLSNILLDQFESITIDDTGFGYGIRGANGVIELKSRETPLFEDDFDRPFSKVEIKEGFSNIDRFSVANYTNYDNIVFKSLGAISWKPVLIVNNGENGSEEVNLKIKDTHLKNLIIHIEGISKSGELHSYKIPLDLDNSIVK